MVATGHNQRTEISSQTITMGMAKAFVDFRRGRHVACLAPEASLREVPVDSPRGPPVEVAAQHHREMSKVVGLLAVFVQGRGAKG